MYDDRDLLCADELGRPIYPQRVTEAFARLRETAGIRPGRLHDVRHTDATHLLTRGRSRSRRRRAARPRVARDDHEGVRARTAEKRHAGR